MQNLIKENLKHFGLSFEDQNMLIFEQDDSVILDFSNPKNKQYLRIVISFESAKILVKIGHSFPGYSEIPIVNASFSGTEAWNASATFLKTMVQNFYKN